MAAREVAGGEDWGGRGAEEGAATRAAPLAWAQWEESREVRGAAEAVEVYLVSEAGLEVEKVAVRVAIRDLEAVAMAAETGEGRVLERLVRVAAGRAGAKVETAECAAGGTAAAMEWGTAAAAREAGEARCNAPRS